MTARNIRRRNEREKKKIIDQHGIDLSEEISSDDGVPELAFASDDNSPKANYANMSENDRDRLNRARAEHKEEKARKEREAPVTGPIKKFLISLSRICIIGASFVGIFWLMSGAEQYRHERSGKSLTGLNPYQTLGIKAHSPMKEVRRSFRHLSKQWHPDRNPDCGDVCTDKMNEINDAYKVLSDPERKAAYDKSKVVLGDRIRSNFSVDLDSESYVLALASLTDVTLPVQPIVVQVYDPNGDMSQSFAKIWETTAESMSHMKIPFVRINSATNHHLVRKLPVAVQIFPTVLLLERGKSVQILPINAMREPRSFKAWIEDNIGHHGMVSTAKTSGELEEWIVDSCRNRKEQNLPFRDNKARVVVVTISGRMTPTAVVRRTALFYDSIAEVVYASPKAIPEAWGVERNRNHMILLPPCTVDGVAKLKTTPLSVYSFGKTSFGDFFGYFSYLMTNRALPLTRKSADSLCTLEVIGSHKRVCEVHLVEDESDVKALDKVASENAVSVEAFMAEFKKAKLEAVKHDEEEEDSNEELSLVYTPIIQRVYVHSEGADPSRNAKNRTKLFNGINSGKPVILDLTSGYVASGIKSETNSVKTFRFTSDNKVSKCLKSVNQFYNDCLEAGENTAFNKFVYYFKEFTVFEWVILVASIMGLSTLAMNFSGAQWCLFLFICPVIVQAYMFVADFMGAFLGGGYQDEL